MYLKSLFYGSKNPKIDLSEIVKIVTVLGWTCTFNEVLPVYSKLDLRLWTHKASVLYYLLISFTQNLPVEYFFSLHFH